MKEWSHLQDEGQDGGAQRRVVAELLQVTAVLPFGPHRHLDEAHQGEEGHRQALGHQREAEPRAELVGVVGAGDQQEDPGEGVLGGVGDLPGLRARWAEIAQGNMDGEVADLTEQEDDERQSDLLLAVNGGRVQRVVDVVGHPCCKAPVVGAVLEDVAQRHGSVGEAVDKQRLQQPLQVVEGVTHAGQMDHPVFAGGEVVFGGVDEGNPEVEEQVDDQRPRVLRQEDRDPANLRPQVPEVEGGRGANGEMLQNILVLQRLPLGVEADGLPGRVPLRVALVEHGLDLPDGGIWLNLVQEAELLLGLGVQDLHRHMFYPQKEPASTSKGWKEDTSPSTVSTATPGQTTNTCAGIRAKRKRTK